MEANNLTIGQDKAAKASINLALWTFAWVGTLALAVFGPKNFWDSQTALSWAALGLNLAVGVGWIVAHIRFMRVIDELQQKIVQDALAITLGVGFIAGFGYVVAHSAGLVAEEVNIGVFPMMLGVVYIVANLAGHLRFR